MQETYPFAFPKQSQKHNRRILHVLFEKQKGGKHCLNLACRHVCICFLYELHIGLTQS